MALLGWAQLQAQTVHTVDNNAGSVAQFNNLGTAIAAAAPGDIILIAGSPTNYGNHNIYKELHFVGVGTFLGQNGVPGLSNNISAAGFNFYNDNSLGNASGSSVVGVAAGPLQSLPGCNDILVDKCYNNGNNWRFQGSATITRCYTRNDIRIDAADSSISNTIAYTINMTATNQSLINCVVRRQISTVNNQFVRNCIFLEEVSGTSLDLAAEYTYCLKVGGSGLPDNGTNINGGLLSDVFTLVGRGDEDRYYELKEGSAATGKGLGGVDIGAFGGAKPYVLGMVPGRPRIARFDVPPTATGLAELTIEVQAQAFAE